MWDIELRRFDDRSLYATGVTPRGIAWVKDQDVALFGDDDCVALDPNDYATTVQRIVSAGLTVVDTTPTDGERASRLASQQARALSWHEVET